MRDWHVHVFTSTYTADVSGVCSAMYELGGMTILHDPSGCNSTYTTHDEPRWYDSDSLMYVSGLDEITAVLGDDSVVIRDVLAAAADLSPRFITLCGASIPHIIAFDFRGVARLIEEKCGIPVLPVPTDGLRLYTSGAGLALREWLRRFARKDLKPEKNRINLLGVTPIDFSRMENVSAMIRAFTDRGFAVNGTFAMGDAFENLQGALRASVNVVVSSAGLLPAKFLRAKAGIPYVLGTPVGASMAGRIAEAVRRSQEDGKNRSACGDGEVASGRGGEALAFTGKKPPAPGAPRILIVGEPVFAGSLARGLLDSAGENPGFLVDTLSPDVDEGLDEDVLLEKIGAADRVIADPLFRSALRGREKTFVPFPHEGYSGRIFRELIPGFCGDGFDPGKLLTYGKKEERKV
ncbi:nitrogenase component 1 [Clostridium vitabionis]|uniref:nitrogenase component 1 n=1 Tax=Clostridium vitabionis TaxID=2784388 RepID=UPI00188D31B5|nr:nitrogenase component 1 [Clostridium vitabionis]